MSSSGRPIGVTLIGVLVVISGILLVISGILGIFNSDERGIITAILILIIGLIYVGVAKGLFDGNNFSRLLIGLITVVNLFVGIFQLIFVGGYRINGLIAALVSLVILAVLFSRKATLFFTAR